MTKRRRRRMPAPKLLSWGATYHAMAREREDWRDFDAAVADGLEAARQGRTVPHKKVRRWLASWGSEREVKSPAPAA